jgi:hypothetical protein
MDINDVKCWRCGAEPGQPCKTPSGHESAEPHKARVDAYWAAQR